MPAQLQQTQGWSSAPGGLPLIAVSTSEVRRSQRVVPIPQGEPPQHEMVLGLRYMHAIEAAGGLPVVVAPLDIRCVEPLLSRVASVCLLGGPALDPETYGERRHALPGWTESQLDVFELSRSAAACRWSTSPAAERRNCICLTSSVTGSRIATRSLGTARRTG